MLSPLAQELFAKLNLSVSTTDDLADWAMTELESGRDTGALRVLAGMRGHSYPSEVEMWFERALRELDYTRPTVAESVSWYVKRICGQILSGEFTARQGIARLYALYVALGYPDDLSAWDFGRRSAPRYV